MVDVKSLSSRWSPRLLSVMRIVTGFLFIPHGSQKLFSFPDTSKAAVEWFSLMGLAGALEFFGGLFILFGMFTRPVAFLLSGQMAFAYFMAHASKDFWPILNRGELAVFYCFVFLYLVAAGGGAWSLDRLFKRHA